MDPICRCCGGPRGDGGPSAQRPFGMRGGRGSSVGSRAAVRRGPVWFKSWCVERMVMVERAPMPHATGV